MQSEYEKYIARGTEVKCYHYLGNNSYLINTWERVIACQVR